MGAGERDGVGEGKGPVPWDWESGLVGLDRALRVLAFSIMNSQDVRGGKRGIRPGVFPPWRVCVILSHPMKYVVGIPRVPYHHPRHLIQST